MRILPSSQRSSTTFDLPPTTAAFFPAAGATCIPPGALGPRASATLVAGDSARGPASLGRLPAACARRAGCRLPLTLIALPLRLIRLCRRLPLCLVGLRRRLPLGLVGLRGRLAL